jgi:hypothetical protein
MLKELNDREAETNKSRFKSITAACCKHYQWTHECISHKKKVNSW